MSIASLPDDQPCYVPGFGEVTLGEIRHTEPEPALDQWEATLQMWEDIVTRNLCREPWDPGVSVSEIKAYHVSRYMNALTQRRSS